MILCFQVLLICSPGSGSSWLQGGGGDWDKQLFKTETKRIYTLKAHTPLGLNNTLSFKPFLWTSFSFNLGCVDHMYYSFIMCFVVVFCYVYLSLVGELMVAGVPVGGVPCLLGVGFPAVVSLSSMLLDLPIPPAIRWHSADYWLVCISGFRPLPPSTLVLSAAVCLYCGAWRHRVICGGVSCWRTRGGAS